MGSTCLCSQCFEGRCTQSGTVLSMGTGDSNSQLRAHVLIHWVSPRPWVTGWSQLGGGLQVECHLQLVRVSFPGSWTCCLHFCFVTRASQLFSYYLASSISSYSSFPNFDPSINIKGSPLLLSRLAKPSQLCAEGLAGPNLQY